MPNITDFLKLEKPLETENYNIGVFNANADKLDANAQATNTALLNKAKGDTQGRALDAVKLGGLAAASYAQIEVGTWTPTLIADNGTNPTATYAASGTYVKIGKLAIVTMDVYNITITNAGSGYSAIGGLPFVAKRYAPTIVQHHKELYDDMTKVNAVNLGVSGTWEANKAVLALRNAACNFSMKWATTVGETTLGFLRFSICVEIQ